MRCTCGAVLPVNNRYSLCAACLRRGDESEDIDQDFYEPDELTENEDFEQADEYFGHEDFGDFGYGIHEE